MSGVEGYMYPNEITLYWSVLIRSYPYITGLWRRVHPRVAGVVLPCRGETHITGWRC